MNHFHQSGVTPAHSWLTVRSVKYCKLDPMKKKKKGKKKVPAGKWAAPARWPAPGPLTEEGATNLPYAPQTLPPPIPSPLPPFLLIHFSD